jgi:hypothetical protein
LLFSVEVKSSLTSGISQERPADDVVVRALQDARDDDGLVVLTMSCVRSPLSTMKPPKRVWSGLIEDSSSPPAGPRPGSM